jgi:hypothetical protein
MTIYHKHHKIPKYLGGDDSPENIIELTIEEHAEEHRILYEKYGNIEDMLAWKGLLGLITKEEILSVIYEENGRRLGKSNAGKPAWNKGLTKDDPRVLKYVKPKGYKFKDSSNMGRYKRTSEVISKLKKPKSEEHKNKIKQKSIEQWSNLENRKRQSERCKNNRDVCPYCGMESNKSNITRHKKMCKFKTSS